MGNKALNSQFHIQIFPFTPLQEFLIIANLQRKKISSKKKVWKTRSQRSQKIDIITKRACHFSRQLIGTLFLKVPTEKIPGYPKNFYRVSRVTTLSILSGIVRYKSSHTLHIYLKNMKPWDEGGSLPSAYP